MLSVPTQRQPAARKHRSTASFFDRSCAPDREPSIPTDQFVHKEIEVLTDRMGSVSIWIIANASQKAAEELACLGRTSCESGAARCRATPRHVSGRRRPTE